MAELPFTEPLPAPAPPPEPPYAVQVPRASGLRKTVVGSVVLALLVGGTALFLFAAKGTQQLTHRTVPAAPDPTPRPITVDPLRGVPTDYGVLLQKPLPAQPPGSLPPTAGRVGPAAVGTPEVRRAEKPREVGMLILEGKQRRAALREPPAPPQSPPAGLVALPEPVPAASPPSPSGVDRQRAFLEQAQQARPTQVDDRLHTPESAWMVLAGDIIPATLVTGIQSDLPGELLARVRQNVRDSVQGLTVLIPQGTLLLGRYSNEVIYGQDRVLVVWHRMRLPNGQTLQLEGMPGVDLSGYAGLKDRVNTHLWPLFRSVLLSSVLSIGSRLPAGSSPQNVQPSLPQEFAADFGSAANRAGQQIVQRELQRPPTVTIRPGMAFNVFVLRDMVLQPYLGRDVGRSP